ncbi:ribonuclease catalytic domain-containing protein [Desulfonema magnum]|uniref:Ribonuclease domain-containing protein n=1 Tax=Desulfonema magnum TaxID=45655 RepID=A0A975GSQ6_9BACT|nr:ribonuclease catalytic domain-containing protein [Desulfonema magnum]QTA91318.1 Ribonuclease domain-containing protein [Desulfonema magnum]
MESGNIIEYIDRQKIICAVVLEVKTQKLRLLTETNREVKLSENRLSHKCKDRLNLSSGRDRLVEALKDTVNRRMALVDQIDVRELWDVLNTEQEWIDLATMTEFCFPDNPSQDHEAAVVRAFFYDKLYFKFNPDRFFPNSEEQVEQIRTQTRETTRKNRIIEEGGIWLRNVLNDNVSEMSEDKAEFAEILKSVYLFEKNSKHYDLGKAMLAKAGIKVNEMVFDLFVKLGIWDQDEHIELYQYEIPIDFADPVIGHTKHLVEKVKHDSTCLISENNRRDLTDLPLITIDGQATLDFDDALSIEDRGDHYCLGVHIADVGHYVKKGDKIDREAIIRGSSIYLPDQKIPMMPPSLAEDICSLRAGELRPAVSTLIKLSPQGEIIDYEIVPSRIRVKDQLTYYDVNMIAEEDKNISVLHDIAQKFRQKRLSDGAVQISLPEINIWLENGELIVNKTDRETPGRLLVAETMIMANWLMACFLSKHGIPAIYRTQPDPRERLYREDEGSLFQNWMQRKFLSRFVLQPQAEHHAGLGLDAYVTATSPIRKYFDLITQRQIRSVFGLEEPYTPEEIDRAIQMLEQPMSYVSRVQYRRKRYWLLKYLEGKIGEKEEAIVLSKRRNDYLVLIPEYMTECSLPLPGGLRLKPEDLIQVKIQHVNARKDTLSVFMA